jgi:hypothetical protein
MHLHLRIHRWVVWWFVIGVVCGVVALVNILSRNLTRSQEDVVLILGLIHWILGGLVCYSLDAVRIEQRPAKTAKPNPPSPPRIGDEKEWHFASEFLQPGRRKRLLPR